MIYTSLASESDITEKRRECRLAEENDKFCSTCVAQWKSRFSWETAELVNRFCHVCGNKYEAHDILLAQPITISDSYQDECSICCRECYDAIAAILATV